MGGIDFITKPFNEAELLARIGTHLQLGRVNKSLKSKNRILTDSINYARRIQKSLIPSQIMLSTLFSEYLLLYMQKDIVSGDFYWLNNNQDYTLIAVADCTGHGVPGAMMSMLGIAMLNEMGLKDPPPDPNQILSQLRSKLKQSWECSFRGNPKDGMDMGLVLIKKKEQSIQYAGAFSKSLFFSNKQVIEIKGDCQPVGSSWIEKEYTNHDMPYHKGDRIYMFSDGYPDQMGGPNNKKFLYKNFREMIIDIQHLPLVYQEVHIEKKILEWKGENELTDDILVLGLEL